MFRIKFQLVVAMVGTVLKVMAQTAITDIPKTVNYRDAHVIDVGTVCSDVLQWVSEDPQTHKVDTIYTNEEYILWQSDGDIERQAEVRRAQGVKKGMRRAVTTNGRSGSLTDGWLCTFYYNVFKYEYPSVDADGKRVMLSAIAACPTKDDCKEVRDVVIGTHITITANRECPSNTTKGFDEQDWGVLMSFAGGKKIKLGWITNLTFGVLAVTSLSVITTPLWASFGISTEVVSAEPSNNYNLVIMPDYEGYGTTSSRAHPYLYQELTARQVLDATRYGIALYKQDAAVSSFRHPIRSDFRTISCGYSQGGSVAMATHRFIEQNSLVDELHFVGSICGDGPYDPIATLMFYMKRDLEGRTMNMPVVLPLIVKGMLDSNPYMKSHKATDYFTQAFLDTGVMNWLTEKNLSTDDIENKWKEMAKKGQTTIFDTNGKAKMHDIMTPECFAYFKNLYDQYSGSYNTASGVPLPTKRGVFEDLHLALASNDMTEGWTPQHAILLFHSDVDNVVPYDNAERAKAKYGGWAVLHKSSLGHDHVPAGSDFFKADGNIDLMNKLDLRVYTAKHKLCKLQWNGQTTSNIPSAW